MDELSHHFPYTHITTTQPVPCVQISLLLGSSTTLPTVYLPYLPYPTPLEADMILPSSGKLELVG